MNKNFISVVFIVIVVLIIIMGLFHDERVFRDKRDVQIAQTTDPALTGRDPAITAAYSPGACRFPQSNLMSIALTNPTNKIPINAGDMPPTLIKEMGAEVIQISAGKLKVTGVMGGSWAQKGGLEAQDIILSFNGKKIESLQHFQTLVGAVSPEKDYKFKILRNGRIKTCLVTIGEGEMEGFTPIVPVAFMQPMNQNQGFGDGMQNNMNNNMGVSYTGFYRCYRCGNFLWNYNNTPNVICPVCRSNMVKQ